MGEAAAKCERCGQVNVAGQRFCGGCGAQLVTACSACGSSNASGLRFCGRCGEPLGGGSASASIGSVEERRWATVLFADLSGFTSLSETLDPEEVTVLVDRCMHRLGEAVGRYGGVIAQIAGDGLFAIFGVPTAHEDDPERAVRAGLEMQRFVQQYAADFGGLKLRVGVNTGEMMLAAVGPGSRREPTVHGDPVNTASRLETAAPIGGVLVGAATYKATRAAVAYEEVPPLKVKGKVAPVPAWVARKVLGAPASRAVSSLRMVGRDVELALLTRMWERTVADRRPHLATVVGPAGIGKTRLVDELLRRVGARGPAMSVCSGRCLPYGQGITYWPLREILWAVAGISLDDTAAASAQRLRRCVARLGVVADMDPTEVERTTFALATTCGLPVPGNSLDRMSPESISEEVSLAWPRFLSGLAHEAPTVVVIEDLHCAESPLLDMVERVVARSTGRLFIVATARPELAEMRPGWVSRGAMSQIALGSLTEADSRELLDDLLPDARPELYDRVIAAAEGNPLFAEELVRHLGNSEATSTLQIPSTVRALLSARIDVLGVEEKSVVHDAAVVGRAFWEPTLEAMRQGRPVQASLRSLEEKGLVMTRPTSSLPGQTELWFRHALIRDVAYGSIPRRKRAGAHAAVAAWIDDLVGDRRDEFIELLAHHYEAAAAPEAAHLAWSEGSREREVVRAKAVEALLRAGSAAGKRFATEQALGFADRAMALARTDRERLGAHELRARSFHAAVRSDEALASYLEALEIARDVSDRNAVSRLRAYAVLLCVRYPGALTGDAWKTTAAALVDDGLAEVLDSAETFEAGALLVGSSHVPRWLGTPPDRNRTRRSVERAIGIAEAIDSSYLLAHAVEALSQPTVQNGFCEAGAIAERIVAVADTLADRIEAHEARVLAALLFTRAGRPEAAQQAADAAARQAAELSVHRRIHAAAAQTLSLLAIGDLDGLRAATTDLPGLIHEDGASTCTYGAIAVAGHTLSLFEDEQRAAAERAVDLLDRARQGSEGPALLYRAAEIVRPVVGVEATRARIERLAASADGVSRVYELRAVLQFHALSGDSDPIEGLIAEARALAASACAPSLACIADWAEAIELARAGSSAESLNSVTRVVTELEAHGERYTAARLLTDLLPFVDGRTAANAASMAVDRLESMGARASATEARRGPAARSPY